ncbi:type 1 glutamine amidotransferase [Paenibacillus tuaregi]|uniref:type 1 glutamine amidotransferase n=1 Tax=Paenibacillus tuaregi TaxID=1816681 RepID=UPI000838666E|nr:type 1 glutamine amidotransferase [Paenibacillus tuaregi]
MRIHYLQHVPFESPERISDWVKDKGYELTGTLLYESTHFPFQSEFDMLIILGGPMGVYNEENFPWLVREKAFIKETIRQRKMVLGICLGAQLIAEALGGKVYSNRYKEIGWHPVKMTEESQNSVVFKQFPQEYVPFHWHGDTFELPDEVKTAAISLGCANQAFEYNGHVIGLQFHLESSNDSIKKLIEHCGDEIEPGTYVQLPDQMMDQTSFLAHSNTILVHLLDTLDKNNRAPNKGQDLVYKKSSGEVI